MLDLCKMLQKQSEAFQVHFGVDFQADFEDVSWHDVVLVWNHTKDHNPCRKLYFHHPGHVEPSEIAFWGS